ncbi:hypothetical protein K493DRAFT_296209 [Basidiobolus meristosporus CBS 931.73]|uniref:Man1/Src1 C-terminal domain-containing protein n=1 Tax=Basidiobolus meristosporus CBS 931.73 TaxID=1314790 RepID=A0A1Y1Z6T6_9FUNG|nr:hypothetical protein K493DRAFT_296209 [Basidiobolus meristosporus CBS 931.73]|eukprot:ORY05961.1 hypothetical protein K493DRAFT_296209 [Basidiobolus meristosporus CBS 931.73]
MDDLSYLEPGFDPNSVRVVDLRRILFKHGIPFNANSKKATLIELFDAYVTPNAEMWLQEAKDVKPSNRGMIFVGFDKDPERTSPSPVRPTPNSRGRVRSAVEKFELLSSDGELSPPPRQATVRRKIKTKIPVDKTTILSSEGESLRSQSHRASHTPSVDDPGFSSDDFSPLPNSYPHPEITTPEPESNAQTLSKAKQTTTEQVADPGVFSDENPFQSGGETPNVRKKKKVKTKKLSKPEPQPDSPITSNADPVVALEDKPKIEVTPQQSSIVNSTGPRKFMSPSFARVKHEPKKQAEPEVVKPKRRTRRRRHHHREPRVEYEWSSLWLFLGLVLGAYLFWLRQKNMALGYCEHESDADISPILTCDPSGPSGSNLAIFYPQCTPCPSHAVCRNGKFVSCDRNYILKVNPLVSVVNPLHVKCVPDTVLLAKVDSTVELVKEILGERAGQAECDVNKRAQAEVSEVELKRLIDGEIEEIWSSVLRDLTEQQQRIRIMSDTNKQLYFLSLDPKYPLQCRLRKGFYAFLIGYLKEIGASVMVVAAGIYAIARYNTHFSEKELVRDLVQQVLVRLAEQENLHYADPVQQPLSAVSVVQLRDVLLRSMHNHVQRKHIWDKVRKIVETNSNVRSGVTEIRGEPHRVWEWVGTSISPNLSDSLYPKLKEDQSFMSDEGMFSDE